MRKCRHDRLTATTAPSHLAPFFQRWRCPKRGLQRAASHKETRREYGTRDPQAQPISPRAAPSEPPTARPARRGRSSTRSCRPCGEQLSRAPACGHTNPHPTSVNALRRRVGRYGLAPDTATHFACSSTPLDEPVSLKNRVGASRCSDLVYLLTALAPASREGQPMPMPRHKAR